MKIDTEKLLYRKMNFNDLDLFIKLRLDFLLELNKDKTEKNKELIIAALKQYYIKYLEKNEFIGMICEYDGNVISTAYLAIYEKFANNDFINGKVGILGNVYTYPEYRKNGISSNILKKIIEEAKKQDVSQIELIATKDGEKVYYKLGFEESDMKYMELKLFG
jgi:N-acetylglutamate synthase-like GNAT family acetyltransferase